MESGLRIKNIQAGSLWEKNAGIRSHYDSKDALLPNSLFLDFLQANGLQVRNGDSTRDVICLEFGYGTRSFNEDMARLRKTAKAARLEYMLAKARGDSVAAGAKKAKRQRIAGLVLEAMRKESLYRKMGKGELRELFYRDGAEVLYPVRGGGWKSVHYRMLFRSPGKAKRGACMFICDRLYGKALNFIRMGIHLPAKGAKIVEMGAYSSLIASSIVGRLEIDPRNILILKDIQSPFKTDVVSVETGPDRKCVAKRLRGYEVQNALFDGQALMDSSIFPEWGNGYVLLRHHFCKMAAFCCDMQKFFQDYYGDAYGTAEVVDMFGERHMVKDVLLVTTDSAMKWLNFGKSYEYWCKWVNSNGNQFGVVKTAHPSKLGSFQRTSYQMVNSLDEGIMDSVMSESARYIAELKSNDQVFLEYLDGNRLFSNDYEILVELCRQNPDFIRSSYFRERKHKIIQAYLLNLKSGRTIQNAENLVIVGSPYAMLLYAATGKPDVALTDDTFRPEEDAIQCYAERFGDGESLAFFRSPFNSRNNLTPLKNVRGGKIEKYFHLGNQIVAVNLIGTDFQARNNGSDQDSDSGYTTNQHDIAAFARRCYKDYPTIVNNIPKDANSYNSSMRDFAAMDNMMAGLQASIGESSNLAQIAQTYACNFSPEKYQDYVCILSVLAQVAIDSTKRKFGVDLAGEIRRIKNEMEVKEHGYPAFWCVIRKGFDKNRINWSLHCPMNRLYELQVSRAAPSSPTLPMDAFLNKFPFDGSRRKSKRVEALVSRFSLEAYRLSVREGEAEPTDYLLLRDDFEILVREIRRAAPSQNYMGLYSWLLGRAFSEKPNGMSPKMKSRLCKNRPVLMKALYDANRKAFLKCFKSGSEMCQNRT